MIKTGGELSDLTAEKRAKYLMVRERFECPEPKLLKSVYFAVAFMGIGAFIALSILWYTVPEGRLF